jgi:hypothetical protein
MYEREREREYMKEEEESSVFDGSIVSLFSKLWKDLCSFPSVNWAMSKCNLYAPGSSICVGVCVCVRAGI